MENNQRFGDGEEIEIPTEIVKVGITIMKHQNREDPSRYVTTVNPNIAFFSLFKIISWPWNRVSQNRVRKEKRNKETAKLRDLNCHEILGK